MVSRVVESSASWPEDRTVGVWALVLEARGIPYRLRRRAAAEGGGTSIRVQSWFVQRAEDEIRLFQEENPGQGNARPRLHGPVAGGGQLTCLAMALLVIFHVATTMAYPGLGLYPSVWDSLGSANAARILDGQWWRVVTALTLHGDGAHVLGNALIGGSFIILLCRGLGASLGWFLVMLSGALGNTINVFALGPPHDAIGFSTAVFGAAGLLAGSRPFFGRLDSGEDLGFGFRLRRFIRSAFVPVAAGLGLLAMLGSGGENTDLGAHLLGFASGVLLGIAAGWGAARFGRPGPLPGKALLWLTFGFPVFCWGLAFSQR